MTKYPEHEKLKALNGANQTVGDFIEWLFGKYELAEWNTNQELSEDELVPAHRSRDGLLAEFFNIDQNRLEEEKRAMLDEIRRANDEAKKN